MMGFLRYGKSRHSFAAVPAALSAYFLIGIANAHAQILVKQGQNFSDIAENVTDSISFFPALISGVAYLGGLGFGFMGLIKLKDHVDDPSNPLKDAAIRIAIAGCLFSLPIIYEASLETIGDTDNFVDSARIKEAEFKVTQ